MQLLQNEAAEYLLTRAQKWWHVPVTSEPQVRGHLIHQLFLALPVWVGEPFSALLLQTALFARLLVIDSPFPACSFTRRGKPL